MPPLGFWNTQSNNNSDCVNEEDRFKFVDDLTILEIVNLLTIGIASFNINAQVPLDILDNNQIIPSSNLRSRHFLDEINLWTKHQKMMINKKKSKTMVFNFTKNTNFPPDSNLKVKYWKQYLILSSLEQQYQMISNGTRIQKI